MRTKLLVSRIKRVLMTGGASGDGAALAEEYSKAVNAVNARLEAVVASADGQAIGDAIRMLAEDPPLLEEVGLLDFLELQDWKSLCGNNGWRVPAEVDKQMAERALEVGDSGRAIEPFLAMYKKAVRTNNIWLSVKSLRRLADLDPAQGWERNLRQAERQLQMAMVAEFGDAQKNGLIDVCDHLAQELLESEWMARPDFDGMEEIRRYRERREAERRDSEGRENVEILKKCLAENWNRRRALSLVQAIDALAAQGWRPAESDAAVVEECRLKCASELEQEAKSRRWRKVNEKLFEAIQREDCEEIRAALSAPEFLDADPEEGMLALAEDILGHAAAAKQRRVVSIVLAVVVGVLSVLGLSGWWLKQKIFAERRDLAAAELAKCEQSAEKTLKPAIRAIAAILDNLKRNDPAIYAESSVGRYEEVLKILENRCQNLTNDLEAVLSVLEKAKDSEWSGIDESGAQDRFAKAETLIAQVGEAADRKRLLEAKLSWQDCCSRRGVEFRAKAEKAQKEIADRLRILSESLGRKLFRDGQLAEAGNVLREVENWRSQYAKAFVELDGKLSEAEKEYNDALEKQRVYRKSVDSLKSANDAVAATAAIRDLVQNHSGFAEVEHLRMPELNKAEIMDILSPPPTAVKDWLNKFRCGISHQEFETFLREYVAILADDPSMYSLYGIVNPKDDVGKIMAVSRGRPDISRPSYRKDWRVTSDNGDLLVFGTKRMENMLTSDYEPNEVLMPSSVEMKDLVDYANEGRATLDKFEEKLLGRIEAFLKEAHDANYVRNQKLFAKYYNPVKGWASPYRRVAIMAMYIGWLKENLKLMPEDTELERWNTKLQKLSGEIQVDAIDDSLGWICIWDGRVRRRMVECAELLNEMPQNWVAQYREKSRARKRVAEVGKWRIEYAGKVIFNPDDDGFERNPHRILLEAKGVQKDHPLYVLRKIDGKIVLVRAFAPSAGKPIWAKCAEVENDGKGYAPGEPLYHVRNGNGEFIDVRTELDKIKKAAKAGVKGHELASIPVFCKGGE